MITAVDSNVLLDLLIPGSQFGMRAESALNQAADAGPMVLCETVYAEMSAHFPSAEALDHFLDDTGLHLEPSGRAAHHLAGQAWVAYARRRPRRPECPRCGAGVDLVCPACEAVIPVRQHVLADFVVGAHAATHADRLITRDRGFYGTYFPQVPLA